MEQNITLEKSLFSIFLAMDSLSSSGITFCRISLCCADPKNASLAKMPRLTRNRRNKMMCRICLQNPMRARYADLIVVIINEEFEPLPLPDLEHGNSIKPRRPSRDKCNCPLGIIISDLHAASECIVENLGRTVRYDSKIASKSFFFVVICATISLISAMIVPKRDAAHRNRKTQKI
jgi:hypothetical protein